MSRMEDGWPFANDNGLSWKRQILWRKADRIATMSLSPAQKLESHNYLQKLFGDLDKEES